MTLHKPTAVSVNSGKQDDWTVEEARGILTNPLYCGIHPDFPCLVSRELWIGANVNQVNEIGIEQFLVNLIHVLDESFKR